MSIFQLEESISTKTGSAPHLIIEEIHEIIVKFVTITSSPFFRFKPFKHKSRATDQLETDIS